MNDDLNTVRVSRLDKVDEERSFKNQDERE